MDTSITKIIKNTIIVKWVKSGKIYLLHKSTSHCLAHYENNEWTATTGELSVNYYENNTDFELIK